MTEDKDYAITQLRMSRGRHAYQVKIKPNTHLRGRPRKEPSAKDIA